MWRAINRAAWLGAPAAASAPASTIAMKRARILSCRITSCIPALHWHREPRRRVASAVSVRLQQAITEICISYPKHRVTSPPRIIITKNKILVYGIDE